jgi:hypothetical protein
MKYMPMKKLSYLVSKSITHSTIEASINVVFIFVFLVGYVFDYLFFVIWDSTLACVYTSTG